MLMNNKISFKDLFIKLKEAWKDPRKKAGIKLLSYFIFFFVFMLMASIVNSVKINDYNKPVTTTTTTTVKVDKYNDKQKDLLTNKYNVSYVINISENEYKINGTLENNIVNGYLESNSGIKKIVIKNNTLYEIVNDSEVILESDIDANFISLDYIIDLIKTNRAIIKDENGIKTYTYNINDIKAQIYVETDEENINNINIDTNTSKYNLNFDK